MKRLVIVAVACCAASLSACTQSKTTPAASQSKGTPGQIYYLTASRPVGGTIYSLSADGNPDGKIRCGTASPGTTANQCGPVAYAWNATPSFQAVPDDLYKFNGWAGDCAGTGSCTVSTANQGADKWIAAAFEPTAAYRGIYFVVAVERPVGGTIISLDGRINCGTVGGAANACGPTLYAWNATVTLDTTADDGQWFRGWAGDCTGLGLCVLDTSTPATARDKSISASFTSAADITPLTWDEGNWDEHTWSE